MHAPIRKGSTRWLTLAAMSLGYGVVQLDVTIVNVAIASIGGDFGGGVTALQWVVNAYTVALAALILSAGALGDRIGAKRVFMAGFAIFTLASLGCALAPTVAVLITLRAVQGLAAVYWFRTRSPCSIMPIQVMRSVVTPSPYGRLAPVLR